MEYKCEDCGKVFAYKSRYEEHKNRKTSCKNDKTKNAYQCEDCGMIFIYKSKLEEHKNKKKPCKTYNTASITENPIENDNITQNKNYMCIENNEFKCLKCNKTFSRKFNLEVHVKTCKGSKLECPICHKIFKNTNGRAKHQRTVKCQPIEKQEASTSTTTTEKENVTDLKKKIKELEKENEVLKSGKNVQINNMTNSNNTTYNNTNNIIINFSKEEYDVITHDFVKGLITNDMSYEEFLASVIRGVMRETKNYKITNLRSKYALAYEDGKFVAVPKDTSTSSLMEKVGPKLCDALPKNKASANQYNYAKAFEKSTDDEHDDPAMKRETRNLVEVEIYNISNEI